MSRVAIGRVVDGRVVVEGESLPEGARVTVVLGDEAAWELEEASIQELLQAAADAEKNPGVEANAFLDKLNADL